MTYDHSVELTRKDGSARRFRIYGQPAPNKGEIITLPIEGHLRLIPLSQVGPYVVSWPPAPVNRDGCKGAGRGEGTNSERISGWLSG
jgi:hypothetical protein